ncbi:hypothetical protein [Tenacibaculum haliotis]|uniref:hypothetical protein n=1 Tax=Tenacibaculum haliotis TaxID=1888914 RepID=UPI0021AF39F6|nr:hypothetical protein [Tenacibaculum haliotis]MCT4699938.1 hypothetical protein [Tenacibaculum haliotis]
MNKKYVYLILIFVNLNLLAQEKGRWEKVKSYFNSVDSLQSKRLIVYNDFSFNKMKIISNNLEQVDIKLNEDKEIKQVDFFKENKIVETLNDDYYFINSNNNLFSILDDKIQVINTLNDKKSSFDFYLLEHILKITLTLNDEIDEVFIANSCFEKEYDEEGAFIGNNIILKEVLPDNVTQIVLKGDKYIYLYKVKYSLKDGIKVFADDTGIFRYQLSGHWTYSNSAIEEVYLNINQTDVKTIRTKYTDFKYSLSKDKFVWRSNNHEQTYSLKKITKISEILNELF